MPPVAVKDAIVIVLDVGKSVSCLDHGESKTFFEQSRDCVSWIIQRKLISQSTDALSLLLIGSNESNNQLASSGYKNISCKFEFQQPSWDMLKFIETEVQTTNDDSDWVGAVIIAMEMLKVFEEYNNIRDKKIVIFSKFDHCLLDDFSTITKNIKALNVFITVIGFENISLIDDIAEEENEPLNKKTKFDESMELKGEKLVYALWKKHPGNIGICSFESAFKQLSSYTRKSCRVTPWLCILDIGNVKINISMVKKTDPKSGRKFNTKCLKPSENDSDPCTSSQIMTQISSKKFSHVIRDTVMFYKHSEGVGCPFVDVEVKPEDTIEAFRYGRTLIPFSEEDKKILEYKSGPKSFSLIGFTSMASFQYYLLSGGCSYIVLPRDKDDNAEVALSAIIQAMKKTECLGIVRRVYSDNRGLSLGILFPCVEEVYDESDEVSVKEFLLYVEIAFSEEVKRTNFFSLKRVAKKLTKKQLDVIDDLIEGMDLTKAEKGLRGEPCEAFDLASLHDLKEQFYHHCVIQRGLYPEKPLPSSPPPHIKQFIKRPKLVEEKCQSLVKKIQEQFNVPPPKNLEKSKESSYLEKGSNTDDNMIIEHFDSSALEKEKNRVKLAWMKLFSKGFPSRSELEDFLKICDINSVSSSTVFSSFASVVSEVRQKYLKIDPKAFNWWIARFKDQKNEKSGLVEKLWDVLIGESLGIISKEENKYSNVPLDQVEDYLYENLNNLVVHQAPEEKSPFEHLEQLEIEQNNMGSIF